MINFIIYDNNKNYEQLYRKLILQFIHPINYYYRIISYPKYTQNSIKEIKKLDGETIFILGIDNSYEEIITFAKYIRKNEFYYNPLIICSDKDDFCNLNGISSFYFVNKRKDTANLFTKALIHSNKILNLTKTYKFKINNEIYKIPYNQILYFEKNLNDNSTNLKTKKHNYIINKSINNIDYDLKEEINFYKTHRSCIVNLNNITSINFTTNIISFVNCNTNLISRNKKKSLKELFELYDQ